MSFSRPALALLATLTLALGTTAPAHAEQSANVKVLASLPEVKSAIGVNFIDDTMFVTTAAGIFAYGIADPANPALLSSLPMYIWENEDVDVDRKRKRLFISRDPRGFTTPASPGATFPYGAVHIIDVSNPHAMVQLNVFTLPAGHTTSCVNDCDTIWTGGPFANKETQPGFVGRPIYATDVTDPMDPKPCPAPIDTGRNDGVTDYVHDVQVDKRGVAWVSGGGGVRGYWTSGRHLNPVTGNVEEATGCKPVPYAGSGSPDKATPSRFMHNSWRDTVDEPVAGPLGAVPAAAPAPATTPKPKAKPKKKPRCKTVKRKGKKRKVCAKKKKATAKKKASRRAATGLQRDDVLLATEENVVSDCATSGRFVTYDLRGTYGGEGFKEIAKTKHRMGVLDTWTPEKQAGSTGCASAHYFTTRPDNVATISFYEQGVRFLDVSDPADIRQVGYYREDDSNAFASYWRGDGVVVVADFTRGIEILQFGGGTQSPTVRAPQRAAAKRVLRFERDVFAGLCPLPQRA